MGLKGELDMHELTAASWTSRLTGWAGAGERVESVAVHMALGRVLASPVIAARPVPPEPTALVRGFAVAAADTGEGVYLEIGTKAHAVEPGQPLPPGTDTVLEPLDYSLAGRLIWIVDQAEPGRHVQSAGTEMKTGDLVLPAGLTLTGPALVAALAAGLSRVDVVRKPRVVIYPFADGQQGAAFAEQVPDIASIYLATAAQEWGAEPQVNPLVTKRAQLRDQLSLSARSADLLAVVAGNRKHGAALTMVGGIPCLHLPAGPTEVRISAWRWLRALLAHWYGQRPTEGTRLNLTVAQPVKPKPSGCLLLAAKVGDRYVGWPLPGALGGYRGAVAATALLAGDKALQTGDATTAELLEPVEAWQGHVLLAATPDAATVHPLALAPQRRIHVLTLLEDEARAAVAAGFVHGQLRGKPGDWWLETAPGVDAADLNRQLQDAVPGFGTAVPDGWARSG